MYVYGLVVYILETFMNPQEISVVRLDAIPLYYAQINFQYS